MSDKSSDIRREMDRASNGLSRRNLLRGGAGLTLGLTGGSLIGGGLFPERAWAAGLVNIEVDAGQNENPFRWNADAMKSKFGADIKMIGLPFVGQYEKLVSELTARSAAYDLLVFPPYFLGDFVALGFLQPLEPYFSLLDPQIGDDYIPVYKDPVIKRDGKTYALMYDGDMLQVAYRKDLFDDPTEQKNFKAKYGWDLAPAANWDQFMQISEFFTRPPNLYGTAFYAARGFCYAWFINIFAGLGGRWFSDDMKPGINSDAGVKALETLVKMKDYAVPNILQIDYPALNEVFLNGSTAMVIQWNDLALKVANPQMSKVVGKGAYAACPVRTYLPYSRVMAVSAFAKNPQDAYRVAAYMQLPDVTITYVYDFELRSGPLPVVVAEVGGGDEEPHRRAGARRDRRQELRRRDPRGAQSRLSGTCDSGRAALPGYPRSLCQSGLGRKPEAERRARRRRARMGQHHGSRGSRSAKGGICGMGQVVQGRRRQLLTLRY